MQIEEYLADQDFSPRTTIDYRRDLQAFYSFSGGEMPTAENVRAWIDHLTKKKRSITRIQRCLYALKGYCQWMGIDIFAGRHEKSKDKIRAPLMIFKDIPPTISIDDVTRLFQACQTPRDTMLMKLLSTTGSRIGELLQIKVASDINWEKNTIGLTRKGHRGRRSWLAVSEDTMQAIKDFLDWRHTDSPLLLPFSYNEIHRSFKALAKRAGVKFPPNSKMHNLRHVYSLIQKEAGVDDEILSQALGHSSTYITNRMYGKLSPQFIKKQLHPTPWEDTPGQ